MDVLEGWLNWAPIYLESDKLGSTHTSDILFYHRDLVRTIVIFGFLIFGLVCFGLFCLLLPHSKCIQPMWVVRFAWALVVAPTAYR